MLGEFIIKILVLVLGYLYPAFECFKTIEQRSRANMEQLLFWCQYWVIIAILTAIERFGDIFVSWLPLYGESKLAFLIYLWHPKTKGTSYVYDTFLRPFMAEHEMDIETRMQQIMARTGDLLVFYFKNFVDRGQSLAFEVLDRVLARPRRSSAPPVEDSRRQSTPPPIVDRRDRRRASPPPPVTPRPSAPPLEHQPPRVAPPSGPTVNYPTVETGNDLPYQVNRVEEALRAAGVNLPGLRRRP